jgi:hypothetical protein
LCSKQVPLPAGAIESLDFLKHRFVGAAAIRFNSDGDSLWRPAPASIQDRHGRSDSSGGGRLRVGHHLEQRPDSSFRAVARKIPDLDNGSRPAAGVAAASWRPGR